MMKRFLKILLAAAVFSLLLGTAAYAGSWKQDSKGWWYMNDDGSFKKNCWFKDEDGKWYCFNPDGYMYADTITPDGCLVSSSGAMADGGDNLFLEMIQSKDTKTIRTLLMSRVNRIKNFAVRYLKGTLILSVLIAVLMLAVRIGMALSGKKRAAQEQSDAPPEKLQR